MHMFFWLALTLMLGTFFDSVGAVIAIPIALAFGQSYLAGIIPSLIYIVPWSLSAPVGSPEGELAPVAASLMVGDAPFSWIPLVAAPIFSILFIAVAIWRFNRQEF